MYPVPKRKRQRIAKACNFCRHRKVKCNGQHPCSNCQQAGIHPCTYAEDSTKSSKQEGSEKSKSVDARLRRLEILIEELTSKVKVNLPNGPTSVDDSVSDYNSVEDAQPSEFISNDDVGPSDLNHYVESSIGKKDPGTPPQDTDKLNLERFSGSHFNICRLSYKFIEELRSKLPKDKHDILIPIENMQLDFAKSVRSFEVKWINAPILSQSERNALIKGTFINDAAFVSYLLDKYYEQNSLATYICAVAELKELFGIYFNSQKSGFMVREFRDSELLIMSITLTMSIYALLDECKRLNTKEHIEEICHGRTVEELTKLCDKYFSNALFYYHRVLLLNDGIQTVKALLLLFIFSEYNISNSRVDLSLLYIAIRYAQDLDFHTNGMSLPPSHQNTRNFIWWLIETFDVEMSFRKGKPPIIDILDSIILDSENNFTAGITSFDFQHNYQLSYYRFTSILNRIRRKTYIKVFNKAFTTFDDMRDTLDELNDEMLSLSNLFPSKYRPLLADNHDFDDSQLSTWINDLNFAEPLNFALLSCHISFYSQSMLLNTIPSIYTVPTSVDPYKRCAEYSNITAYCCKTILDLAARIDRLNIPGTFMNTIFHHVSSAYLSLLYNCINFPLLHNTIECISLLLIVTDKFFAAYFKKDFSKEHSLNSKLTKETKLELLCVVALQVGIAIIENEQPAAVVLDTTNFKEHIRNLKEDFPFIFRKPVKHDSMLPLSQSNGNGLHSHSSDFNPIAEGDISSCNSNRYQPSSESSTSSDMQSTSCNSKGTKSVLSHVGVSNGDIPNRIDLWNEMSDPSLIDGRGDQFNVFFDSDLGI